MNYEHGRKQLKIPGQFYSAKLSYDLEINISIVKSRHPFYNGIPYYIRMRRLNI